jgi:hypothetical protein
LEHFELLVVKTPELMKEVGGMDVAGSDVFKGTLILGDCKSVFEFFLSDFFFKLISLEMNSGKSQQEGHLLLNRNFPFSAILKRRLNDIQSIRYVIIMHLNQRLDSVKFNVSRVTLEVLTETDVTLLGLVVVFFC